MEFDLNTFITRLKDLMYHNMPIDSEFSHSVKKHKGHMRVEALQKNSVISVGLDKSYFEIGNENAERITPHYHILEDAQVISKKGKGTARTKGSQELIKDLGKRDYGQATVKFTKNKNGIYNKNVYKEYRKNVRGERSLISKATRKITDSSGNVVTINRNAKYYENIHYHYIEKNLEFITKVLASEFDMELKRTQIDKFDKEELKGSFYDVDEVRPDSFGEGA